MGQRTTITHPDTDPYADPYRDIGKTCLGRGMHCPSVSIVGLVLVILYLLVSVNVAVNYFRLLPLFVLAFVVN